MKQKNKTVAAALAFFLGTLGIHRFYVGKNGTGVLMLLLTITVFGVVITVMWSLIDFLMILLGKFRDKQGNSLT